MADEDEKQIEIIKYEREWEKEREKNKLKCFSSFNFIFCAMQQKKIIIYCFHHAKYVNVQLAV